MKTVIVNISSAGEAGSFFYNHGDRVEIISTSNTSHYLELTIKIQEHVLAELESEDYDIT